MPEDQQNQLTIWVRNESDGVPTLMPSIPAKLIENACRLST